MLTVIREWQSLPLYFPQQRAATWVRFFGVADAAGFVDIFTREADVSGSCL